MSNSVQPSNFINYISEWKKIFITQNGGAVSQLFKIDSNISDDYYFQIKSRSNQTVSLSGRTFQIYGSIEDSKNVQHILFYTPSGTIEANNVLHFHINTYNQEYLAQIKTTKQANITIVETTGEDTQVVLRDVCLCYKRPYIENYVPAEVYTVRILTGTMPWVNEFGAGQNINLIEGTPNYAFGSNLSTASNQFVIGDTNEMDGTKAFIVANSGNVFTVDYEGNVEAASLTINGSQVATASDLTGFATEDWVESQGYLTEHQDLTDYATKDWVEEKGYITGVNLDSYATKSDLALSTTYLDGQISHLTNEIPTKTSDLTNDSGYITGYTAGSGIQINNNVISLTGELGETYTADEDTLKLVNNQFSIKSVFPMIKSAGGVTITKDSEGITYLKVTTSGGGGTSTEYFAGTGLELGSDPELPETTFSINTTWLAAQINSVTSGLQNYTAGDGISIVNNVISVSGDYASNADLTAVSSVVSAILEVEIPTSGQIQTQIEKATSSFITSTALNGYATQEWVGEQGYLTAHQSLSAYATSAEIEEEYAKKTDIPETSAFVTSTFVEDAISGKADKTDLEGLVSTAQIADMATTGWVTGYTSAFITAEDLPTEKTKVSQLQNDVGYITITSVPDVTGFATKTELQTVSSTIEAQIPDVSNLATKTELESVSGELTAALGNKANSAELENYVLTSSMSAYATSAWVDENYALKSDVPTNVYTKSEVDSIANTASGAAYNAATGYVDNTLTSYYNKTQVDTALALKANVVDVYDKTNTYNKEEVNAISTALSSAVSGAGYLTEHQSLADYYTKPEVNTITGTLEGEITGKVAQSDFNSLCTAFSGAIDGKTTSAQVSSIVTGYNYLSSITVNYNDQHGELQTGSVTGITLTGSFINGSIQNNKLELEWAGMKCDGRYFTEIDSNTLELDTIDDPHLHINISDYYTSEVSGAAVDAATGWVDEQNYLTAHQSLTAYATEADLQTVSSAIPTKTSDLTNDSGYITLADVPEGTIYGAGDGLKLENNTFSLTGTILTGGTNIEVVGNSINFTGTIPSTVAELDDASDYAKVADLTAYIEKSASGEFATSGQLETLSAYVQTLPSSDTQYTAGTGLKLEGTEFSLTATIPSVEGLASEQYVNTVSTALNDVITTKIDADYLTTNNYAQLSDIPTAEINEISGKVDALATASGDFALKSELPTVPTNVGAFTNDAGYQTATDVTNAISSASGNIINGLATSDWVTNTVSSSLQTAINGKADSSAIPTVATLSADMYEATSANIETQITSKNYITAQDIPAAPSTVYDKLSAGDNISLSKDDSTGITTISASGGGGGSTYTAGDYISIVSDTIAVTGLPTSANVSAIVTGYGYITGYTAGEGISIENGVIAATGGGGGSGPTNKQVVSTGFVYDSSIQIYQNEYTPIESAITLDAFTVPEGALVDNEVAVFEEWITTTSPITGVVAGDGVVLVGELPTTFTEKYYYVFSRRIMANGTQLASFEYQSITDINYITPLTFKGKAATNAVQLNAVNSPSAVTLQYRKNNGAWQDYSIGTTIPFNQGETVGFKGSGSTFSQAANKYYRFAMTGSIEARGNVQSLVNFSNTAGNFAALFSGCTALVSPPLLTAETLTNYCYVWMFMGCTALTTAPELPAPIATEGCYQEMFENCTSLSVGPTILPAPEIFSYTYQKMFSGCTSLVNGPEICATSINGAGCMTRMFEGCSHLQYIKVHFTAWPAAGGAYYWVYSVPTGGKFVKPTALPERTASNSNDYIGIPNGWTVETF